MSEEINKLIEAYQPKLVELHNQINGLISENKVLRKKLIAGLNEQIDNITAERNMLTKKLQYAQERLKVIENHKAGNQNECKYCWDMKIIAKEALAEIERIK